MREKLGASNVGREDITVYVFQRNPVLDISSMASDCVKF
jgi:hypothetical protein